MGAIAVSAEDERRIARLAKRLGLGTKAGVVRLAVAELERRVARQQMGTAIREYVQKYGGLDRHENAVLSGAGVARDDA
jgi:predicted kinase